MSSELERRVGEMMRRHPLSVAFPVLSDFELEPYRARPKATIPPLDVPPAAVEPAPEPESASVQLLRSLLAERRAEREKVDGRRKSRIAEVKKLEEQLAGIRSRIADDERHLAAADNSIDEILGDIEILGGRPEAEKA